MVPSFFYLHLILGHKRERMIIVSALRAKRERVSERLWCARPIERWSARTTPLHSCSTAETEWYSSFFVFYYYYHIYTVYTTYFFLFLSWGVFISFFRLLLSVKNFVFFLSLLSLLRRSILFGWVASLLLIFTAHHMMTKVYKRKWIMPTSRQSRLEPLSLRIIIFWSLLAAASSSSYHFTPLHLGAIAPPNPSEKERYYIPFISFVCR
jgi:hypothetical protein